MSVENFRIKLHEAIRMYCVPEEKEFWIMADRNMQFVESHREIQWEDNTWIDYYQKLISMLFRQYTIRQKAIKELRSMDITGFKWYFITVGYDDANITIDKIKKYSTRVAESKDFTEVIHVNEKFRRNDKGEIYIHHHTHFLVKCDLPKSRVIDRVYASVKNVVASKNFVDVIGPKDGKGSYSDKLRYVNGDKVESKMECVHLDRAWRIENNIY